MNITETAISGAFIVEIEPHRDERGMFARTFCAEEFTRKGMASVFPQCNISVSARARTLRGMHYQQPPVAEAKLVRVTRGHVFDVAVDLRAGSASYLQWAAAELRAERHNAFYIPQGCAHGFLTLEDDCEVFYQMSAPHVPSSARSVRWNDPAFGIDWPFEPLVINERDAGCPYFSREDDT
jgi:dTDP-4-dehydrorhamnose 3,5-epimerase